MAFLKEIKVSGPLMYPSTRYQGSKRKLVDWLWEHFENLPFETVLDAFGGTASVSLLFKKKGKTVHFNDRLFWNAINAEAFVLNSKEKLRPDVAAHLVEAAEINRVPGLIAKTFGGIYFTDEENLWLDGILPQIHALESRFERAIAFHALFQSCLVKRPYNLFHRKNLSIRTANVKRGFGNKTTWDRSFSEHFQAFAKVANDCIFDNGRSHCVTCEDVMNLEAEADLVYLDPPYISAKGIAVDYHQFYHFLEGLARPEDWTSKIDFGSKHRRMVREDNPWVDKMRITREFERIFEKHRNAIIAVSYRSDGHPSVVELSRLLGQFKKSVRVERRENYRYALSASPNDEVLLIGT